MMKHDIDYHKSVFIVGKNLSSAANKVARVRFAQLKATVTTKNPDFWNVLQYTESGAPCAKPCYINPINNEEDICKVHQGGNNYRTETCVKVANISSMREIHRWERKQAIELINKLPPRVDEVVKQYEPVEQYYEDVKQKRSKYSEMVAQIRSLKDYVNEATLQIEQNAISLEDFKLRFNELKSMLYELKSSWEIPDADCTGLPGYEKDLEGDGVYALYYPNVLWKGEPIKAVEKRIKFFWSNEAPVAALSPHNFSATFKGFIRAPESGEYIFTCETDDGCILKIGKGKAVQDNLPDEPTTDLLAHKKEVMNDAIKNGNWDTWIVPPSPKGPPRFPRTPRSEKITLKKGEFQAFEMHILHSVNNSLFEDGNAFAYLFWESNQIKKQIIPQIYLYTEIREEQLVIMNYDAGALLADISAENDNAFFDTDEWKIKYLPEELRGLFMLKTKSGFSNTEISLNSNKNIRISISYDSAQAFPLPSDFKKTETEFALLRFPYSEKDKLDKGEIVKSTEDLSMRTYYHDYAAGPVSIPLVFEESVKLIILITQLRDQLKLTCAGTPFKISEDPNYFLGCEDNNTAADNDCANALKFGTFWQATDSPALLTLNFKSFVMPTRLIFKPDPESGMKPMIITVNYNGIDNEKLQIMGAVNEFALVNGKPTSSVVIEIDKGKTGINIQLEGMECIDQKVEKEKEVAKLAAKLGVDEPIMTVSKDCSGALDQMDSNKVIVECPLVCKIVDETGTPTFEKKGEQYTRTSKICAAAADFYKDDVKELMKKKYGVRKVPISSSEYMIKFDAVLTNESKDFKIKQEVDIMVPNKCFIRGIVTSLSSGSTVVMAENINYDVTNDKVFPCGMKLTEPCVKSSGGNPIKIKFCDAANLAVCKAKLKEFTFFDIGDIGTMETSGGMYYYGWDKAAKHRMYSQPSLDKLSASKLEEGTLAVMDDETLGEWGIDLINSNYKVVVAIKKPPGAKYVDQDKYRSGEFELDINGTILKGKLTDVTQTLVLEVPKIKLTTKRIIIKRLKGGIGLISVEISPVKVFEKGSSKKEVGAAKTETFVDCPLKDDTLNCVYEESDVANVACQGIMSRLDYNDDIKVACKMKCWDKALYKKTYPNSPIKVEEEKVFLQIDQSKPITQSKNSQNIKLIQNKLNFYNSKWKWGNDESYVIFKKDGTIEFLGKLNNFKIYKGNWEKEDNNLLIVSYAAGKNKKLSSIKFELNENMKVMNIVKGINCSNCRNMKLERML